MKKNTPLPLNSIIFGVIFLSVYFGSIHPLLKQVLIGSTQQAFLQPAIYKESSPLIGPEGENTIPLNHELPSLLPEQRKKIETREALPYVAPLAATDTEKQRINLASVGKSLAHRNTFYLRYSRKPDSLSITIKLSNFEMDDTPENYGWKMIEKLGFPKPDNPTPFVNVFFSDKEKSHIWQNNRFIIFASPEFPPLDRLLGIGDLEDLELETHMLPDGMVGINVENTHKRQRLDVEIGVFAKWNDPTGSPYIELSN